MQVCIFSAAVWLHSWADVNFSNDDDTYVVSALAENENSISVLLSCNL